MNYRGSYRHLVKNAQAAMLSGIEIYNKPTFTYRDECSVILFLNAWELALKGLLSKNGKSIFYPKKRKQPYRTLSWSDAASKAEQHFPRKLERVGVRKNLELLALYRDNVVHFYNEKGFGQVVYALAQTCVVNFKDLLQGAFEIDLVRDLSWNLLPISLEPPVDPILYIGGRHPAGKKQSSAVKQFLAQLAAATKEVEKEEGDSGRLLTAFTVTLTSTKRIGDADVVVGVQKGAGAETGPLVVQTLDPNKSHPLLQGGVMERIPELHGRRFTTGMFQAVVWKHELKKHATYCWIDDRGWPIRYSHDVVAWLRRLTKADVDLAVNEYRRWQRQRQAKKRAATTI